MRHLVGVNSQDAGVGAAMGLADETAVPVTERRYLVPFLLITSLFFLWAFGVNLNDILIPI